MDKKNIWNQILVKSCISIWENISTESHIRYQKTFSFSGHKGGEVGGVDIGKILKYPWRKSTSESHIKEDHLQKNTDFHDTNIRHIEIEMADRMKPMYLLLR